MAVSEGKFARYHGGKPFFAEVAVDLGSPSPVPGIEFRCCGRGFFSQGYIEDAAAVGYDDWKAGAKAGVAFALALAGAPAARVVITRISGLSTDTNPSVVGAAAALAVWRALGFEPPDEVTAHVEGVVFSSWQRPADEVPQFAEPDDAREWPIASESNE